MTINKNFATTKKYVSQPKKPRQDAYQQVEDGNSKDEEDNDNNISQIMWTGVLHCTIFKSSSDIRLSLIMLYHTLWY